MATKPDYYWSKEDKDTYHDNRDCPAGTQINPSNREEGNRPPSGRTLCKRCHE